MTRATSPWQWYSTARLGSTTTSGGLTRSKVLTCAADREGSDVGGPSLGCRRRNVACIGWVAAHGSKLNADHVGPRECRISSSILRPRGSD